MIAPAVNNSGYVASMTFAIAPPADGQMMTILSGSNRATRRRLLSSRGL